MTVDITYKDVLLCVEGSYVEAEDRVMYYGDLDGFPGSPSSFSIDSIFVGETDIISLISKNDLEEIEELVLNEVEG